MASMSFQSLLPCFCLMLFCLLAYPLLLMFDIVDNSRVLSLLTSNKKVTCTSRPLNFQCPACPLGKSSHLSLGPTGNKTSASFKLIFSDVWGPAPILSSDGF
jgi:hypothetical protein